MLIFAQVASYHVFEDTLNLTKNLNSHQKRVLDQFISASSVLYLPMLQRAHTLTLTQGNSQTHPQTFTSLPHTHKHTVTYPRQPPAANTLSPSYRPTNTTGNTWAHSN